MKKGVSKTTAACEDIHIKAVVERIIRAAAAVDATNA
jgi:hypothetical protein